MLQTGIFEQPYATEITNVQTFSISAIPIKFSIVTDSTVIYRYLFSRKAADIGNEKQ